MATTPVVFGPGYTPGSIDKIGRNYREAQQLAALKEQNRIAKRNAALERFQGLTKVEGNLTPLDAELVEFGRQNLENMFYENVDKNPDYINTREFQNALREFEMGLNTAKNLSTTTYDWQKNIVNTPENERFISWEGEDVDRFKGTDVVYDSMTYPDQDSLKEYTDLGYLGAFNKRAEDLKGVGKIEGRPEFGVVETGRRVGQEIADQLLKDPKFREQMQINASGPVTTWEVYSKLGPEQQEYMDEQIWNSKKVQDSVKMDAAVGKDTEGPDYKEKKMADIREMIRMSNVDSGTYKTNENTGGSAAQFKLTYDPSLTRELDDKTIVSDAALSLGDATVMGKRIVGIYGPKGDQGVITLAVNEKGKVKYDVNGDPIYERLKNQEMVDAYKNTRLSTMDKPEKTAAQTALNELDNSGRKTIDAEKEYNQVSDQLSKMMHGYSGDYSKTWFANDDEDKFIEAMETNGLTISEKLNEKIQKADFGNEDARKEVVKDIIKENPSLVTNRVPKEGGGSTQTQTNTDPLGLGL